jgi:hypothetical protein
LAARVEVGAARYHLPGFQIKRDPAAYLTSRVNRPRYFTIHTIEAFTRRRGIATDRGAVDYANVMA